jgi:hypothetical protein
LVTSTTVAASTTGAVSSGLTRHLSCRWRDRWAWRCRVRLRIGYPWCDPTWLS